MELNLHEDINALDAQAREWTLLSGLMLAIDSLFILNRQMGDVDALVTHITHLIKNPRVADAAYDLITKHLAARTEQFELSDAVDGVFDGVFDDMVKDIEPEKDIDNGSAQ